MINQLQTNLLQTQLSFTLKDKLILGTPKTIELFGRPDHCFLIKRIFVPIFGPNFYFIRSIRYNGMRMEHVMANEYSSSVIGSFDPFEKDEIDPYKWISKDISSPFIWPMMVVGPDNAYPIQIFSRYSGLVPDGYKKGETIAYDISFIGPEIN